MSGRWRRQLTERERDLVAAVGRFRVVSGRQLQEVFFANGTPVGTRRRTQAALKRLVDDSYLQRLERRVGGVRAGSAAYCYCLGPNGRRLLNPSRRGQRASEPGLTFVRHHLAVAGIWTELVKSERTNELKVIDLQAEPACWRTVPHFGGSEWLKPDLFVSLGVGDFEWRWFIEADLGTVSGLRVERTCRRYAAYYRSGIEQDEHGVFPSVAWLSDTMKRVDRLRAIVEGLPKEDQRLFHVGQLGDAPRILSGGRA